MRDLFVGLLLAVLGLGGCLGVSVLVLESMRRPTRQLWSNVVIGSDEAFVRSTLGSHYKEFERTSAPENYYVSGWRHKVRPISSKILIYMGGDLVLYLWLDESGRVEDIFTGGS